MARGLLQVEEKKAESAMEIVIPVVVVKASSVEGQGVRCFVSHLCVGMVSHDAFWVCHSY
jgi:hypothetical protein